MKKIAADKNYRMFKGAATAGEKASRYVAMANQYLKQVTNITANADRARKLRGIEGAKAKDHLQKAIDQLQELSDYLDNITTTPAGISDIGGGPKGEAVQQPVNPRPIRTRRPAQQQG